MELANHLFVGCDRVRALDSFDVLERNRGDVEPCCCRWSRRPCKGRSGAWGKERLGDWPESHRSRLLPHSHFDFNVPQQKLLATATDGLEDLIDR